MKFLYVLLFSGFTSILHVQDFYKLVTMETIGIPHAESGWDQRMDVVHFEGINKTEYEIYNNNIGFTTVGEVVINEFMASNSTTVADQDGEFEDWIELYNKGDQTVDLSGFFLTDDSANLTKWSFPDGTVLAADDYLIIWADEDEEQDGLHTNFRLSGLGESLILVDPMDGSIVDAIEFPAQATDVSYARIPNGIGDFTVTSSTFNANNDSADCSSLGGDADNDGVCAQNDCNDNDAAIGEIQEAGTGCDDEDSTTENDVILTDGCTCEGTPISPSDDVVINEFLASNINTVADQDGMFDDWIELYNNGTNSVDLSGYFLTDDPSNLSKWAFPEGTIIEADAYLIIWADEDEEQTGLHANFRLFGEGESVLLVDPSDNSVIDAVDFPAQTSDISYGRYPNGTGEFTVMNPTFNASNSMSVSNEDVILENNKLAIFPNPAENYVYLEYNQDANDLLLLKIYNATGALVYENTISEKTYIHTASWSPGMYFVRVGGAFKKLLVR